MNLRPPSFLVNLLDKISRRCPDEIIGQVRWRKSDPPDYWRYREASAVPYLRRWYVLPKNLFFNIYLHEFCRDDDDRALHDHPWWNCSWVMRHGYVEHTIAAGGVYQKKDMRPGDIKFRTAKAAHRVELLKQGTFPISLFFTGPVVRTWGFHCREGWKQHKRFGQEGGC